jgi:hypothetical protein
MRELRKNPWVEGDTADPLLALLFWLALGAILAAILIVLR